MSAVLRILRKIRENRLPNEPATGCDGKKGGRKGPLPREGRKEEMEIFKGFRSRILGKKIFGA